MKTIEKYDIDIDQWTELSIQLNYERAFGMAIGFKNRYIYIIGGSSNTDCIEILDTYREHELAKTELVLLQLNSYIPWFKEIILPIDEEGIIKFCGEQS